MEPIPEPGAAELRRVYGTEQALAPTRRLAAGGLACVLEDGAIRALSWHGVELLRGVAYLLRDPEWGTAPSTVRELQIDEQPDRFELHFELRMAVPEGELIAKAHLHGSAQGEFNFSVVARSSATLHTNRCGFVVLHPADVAGTALTVEHTDGSQQELCFPALISPAQPVFDIRRLRHSPCPGLSVDCRLDAELPDEPNAKFEMEDQRNWSDASFKTYVGSLLDPWPYALPAGRSLRQRVRVTVSDTRPLGSASRGPARAPVPMLRLGPALGTRMPAIGLGMPAVSHVLSTDEQRAVEWLRPSWLVAEVDLAQTLGGPLDAIKHLAMACGAKVQLDVLCPADLVPGDAAGTLLDACTRAGWWPEALRALPTPYLKSYQPQARWPDVPVPDAYARAFADGFTPCQTGGGMLTYFTELNRKRPSAEGLHFIGHTTCPLVHAADDLSVMQTLDTLPHIVRSVRALWPTLAYRLGPATLAMRRNPYGDSPAANPQRVRLAMADDDPRHQGAFGAVWLAGYAAQLAPLGLEVLSFNDSHGASGPLLRPEQPGWAPGCCVPGWAVQHVLARAVGAAVLRLDNLPAGVAGVAWAFDDGVPQVLLANLGAETRSLQLPGRWNARDLSRPCRPDKPGVPAPARACLDTVSLEAYQVLLLAP